MNKIPLPINRFSCFILSLKNNIQLRLSLLVLLVPIALYGCSDSPTSTPPTPKSIPVFESDGIAEKAADILGKKMRYGKPQLAFNDQGDGMSVWTTETGKGLMLMYSIFDVLTGSWSKEGVVANLPYRANFELIQQDKTIIASDGISFGVVWQFENQVYVKMYNMGNSAQWSVATQVSQLPQPNYNRLEASIVAIPNKGYAVAWRTRTDVFITRLNGQNLDNTPYTLFGKAVPLPDGQAFPPGRVLLSYVLLPILDQFAVVSGYGTRLKDSPSVITSHVLFRSYDEISSTWSVTKIISNSDPSKNGRLFKLHAISGINGATVAWELKPNGTVNVHENFLFANILHTNTGWNWDSATQLGVLDSAVTLGNTFDFSAANNSYGFIWKRTVITDTTTSTVFTNIYSETNKIWATPTESIPFSGRTDVNIANNGSTYVATYINQSNGPNISLSAIMASETDSSWSTPVEINQSQNRLIDRGSEIVSNGANFIAVTVPIEQLQTSASTSLETNIIEITNNNLTLSATQSLTVDGVEDMDLTFAGGLIWFLGGQKADVRTNTKITSPIVTNFDENTSKWNSPTYLIQDEVLTSAVFPQMISNKAGNSMLTWYQFNGGKYEIFANFRINGKWNKPVVIGSTKRFRSDTISQYFSPFNRAPNIFLNYTTSYYKDTFFIVWMNSDGLVSKIFDYGVGSDVEPLALKDNAIISGLSQLSMTKTDVGIKTCWKYVGINSLQALNYACKTYENRKWNAYTETFSAITTERVTESKLTINQQGNIGITWIEQKTGAMTEKLYDIYAQVKIGGVLHDVKQLNDISNSKIDLVNVVFDSDNNLAIAWKQSTIDPSTTGIVNNTYVSTFDNNQQWQNHDRGNIKNFQTLFTSNNSGFALARIVFDTIYLDIYENGNWSESQIDLLSYADDRIVKYHLMGINGTYIFYWAQLNENTSFNIFASSFSAANKPTILSPILSMPAVNLPDRLEPNLSSYGDGFALTWGEFDPVEDPATSKIWTKMGDIFTK